MEPMTVFTSNMFELTQQINSVEEAMETLLTYKHFRTLGDVLRSFTPDPDIKKRLVSGLCIWFPDDKPTSIDRKVRNWLNGKTLSISKQDAYIISRILELSLEQADSFLKYAAGEGIHWRNPEDIIWCYSILHHLSHAETWKLFQQVESKKSPISHQSQVSTESSTADVFEKLQPVLYQDEATLFAFLTKEQNRLGYLHNTAYSQFTKYMDLLKRGYTEDGIEALFKEMTREEKNKAKIRVDGDIGPHKPDPISVRDILETYFYRNLIPVQVRGKDASENAFSAIQRSIRQNWPDESILSKMESRKIDVSRKVLILLFMATDGCSTAFSDEYTEDDPFTSGYCADFFVEDEYVESPEDVFLSIYTRLNIMLSDCGFPQLDPRNPFDWIILFCISSGDLWESDARLQELLEKMYPATPDSNVHQ